MTTITPSLSASIRAKLCADDSHPIDASSRRHHLIAALCLAAFCIIASITGHAASEVEREHILDAGDITILDIRAAVGDVRIRDSGGDTIRVRLAITGSRSGLLRRRADVSDMDLAVDRHGSRMELAFLEDNAAADWVIDLPRSFDIDLKLGVGELKMDVAGGDLDLSVGVGEVNLTLPKTAIRQISATTGVGDARIRGGDNSESKRTLVSGQAKSEGPGDARVEVKVGVGAIDIRLR
ncbi:MAG: hypothetical protein JJU22_09505 [Gammaproteobacteria bacterium]|nr:hypothetical protein [Gammaproteobacteria bacterium]